jgi:hypothetical protein
MLFYLLIRRENVADMRKGSDILSLKRYPILETGERWVKNVFLSEKVIINPFTQLS